MPTNKRRAAVLYVLTMNCFNSIFCRAMNLYRIPMRMWMDSNFYSNFRRCYESLHLALPYKRQKQRQVGMYCYDSLDYSTHIHTDDRAMALALRTAAKRKPRKLHFIDTQSYRMHRIRRRPFGFPLQWFEYIFLCTATTAIECQTCSIVSIPSTKD